LQSAVIVPVMKVWQADTELANYLTDFSLQRRCWWWWW